MIVELIGAGVAGAAGVLGHAKSKSFVRRKLRYTKIVDGSPTKLGIAAGAVTACVAAPVVALLPLVGAGTAVVLGLGVGTGVGMGAREAKGS